MILMSNVLAKEAALGFEWLTEREREVYYTHCHHCLGEFDSTGNCPGYCMREEKKEDS